ncbi:hypothetical protein PGT21_009999 [Puccinia graminis f. sp. tritici]|uniref:Secreted protein n=1 Tax=Puccinia graminis f. sp. tritici TaxID=56615 RepID=A0A5B0PRI5_PUCGR|nr:hypothetical protein PGTUg99_011878 [Puccinia graminis f. sp. tritici]KAA1103210.1 hypothetical protein PGT21_009999 [Puccinia graminis f. sp. tritici]
MHSLKLLAFCFLFISRFQAHHAKIPPFLCLDNEKPQALCLNTESVMSECTSTKTVGVHPSNWDGKHNDCQVLAEAHPGKTITKMCCSAKLRVQGDTDQWGFFRVNTDDVSNMC